MYASHVYLMTISLKHGNEIGYHIVLERNVGWCYWPTLSVRSTRGWEAAFGEDDVGVFSCWSVFHCFSSSGFNQIFRAKDALQLQDTESRKCHARSNFIKMTVWVPPTFCCFVHLVNDSHHSYYSYFIITPLGKATQVRMWPRWLTRHNRRKWINRRWKKAKAGSIVWVCMSGGLGRCWSN